MFSTYAAKFILTEIRNELRKYRVFESLNVKKEEIELIVLIPSDTNIEGEYEDKETVQELITSLKILNEKQLKIIMLFYGIGCEQKMSIKLLK